MLLADAYGGYNGVVAGNAITRAGCWSHARRKFIEAEKTAPEIAREAVALVRALFAVEQQAKELSVAERLALRQAQSAPLLAELRREACSRWKEQLLPKHPMAEAVNYALGQWAELNVFCSDGAVPIDNNVSRARDEARGAQPQELFIRRQPARRPHRGHPGQPDQHLPPARRRSATLSHPTVDEPAHLAAMRDLDAWLPDQWKLRHAARLATLNQQNSTTPDHLPSPAPE